MQAKHIKGTISLCAALIAGVALIAASGAGAAKAPSTARIDVSTKAAVVHYLRSIHVNPKGVVIQRGLRNYAGAHCPGKAWRCAGTRHTVVQIAKRGGQNRFVCKSSKCVVVQISGASHGVYASGRRLASTAAPTKGGGSSGVCLKNGSGSPTGMGQICTIDQSGLGPNKAVVWENSEKVAGLNTSLTFTATITQTATGASQGNTACVTQKINLDGSTTGLKGKPVTATLEAQQSVSITQDSSSGPNTAAKAAVQSGTTADCDPSSNALVQSQTLTSTVNATANITQNENALSNGADVVLQVDQNKNTDNASGANIANFTQTMNQTAIANTTNGKTVNQTQSSTEDTPTFSGLVGTLNQTSTGLSTANVVQNETQCEDAANTSISAPLTLCATTNDGPAPTGLGGLNQTQFGPVGIFGTPPAKQSGRVPLAHKGYGASVQTSNPADTFTLTQNSQQDNDTGTGQTNIVQGDCQTSGSSCTATQQTDVNDTTTPTTHTGKKVNSSINCTGSSCPTTPNITSGPTQPSTTNPDATFTFTDGDPTATFLCQIDGSGYTACPSGQSYPNLSCGQHEFDVEGTNTAGDITVPETYKWEVTVCFDGLPGTSVPPGTLGPYTMTPFGADSQLACTNDGTTVTPAPTSSVVDPAGTITFDEALNHDIVGYNGTYPPNCWATWSNLYSGDVYSTSSSTTPGQVTITLPAATRAFYFYAEGDQFATFTVTATEAGGRTSGPIPVNGNAGAKYFGFYGIDGANLASITVTSTDPNGFAIGEFGIKTGP